MKELDAKIFHLCQISKMVNIQHKILKMLLEYIYNNYYRKLKNLDVIKIPYINLDMILYQNIIYGHSEIICQHSISQMIMQKYKLHIK